MNRLCAICFKRPNAFAAKGWPLCYDCFSCPDFNIKKYNRDRRKENDAPEPQLDHPSAESHAETQGSLFRKE
jgi:hypothetical protein